MRTLIDSNQMRKKHVRTRTGLAKAAFRKLKLFMTTANITVRTTTRIFKMYYWRVPLCSVESWHLTKKLKNDIKNEVSRKH